MQTDLADFIRDSVEGREADAILRKCVHCGFCTATCPTYQLLGDELDGPRGRIYLIKQVLEGALPTATTQLHLDRCLTCRSCETTCPSGVHYGRLLDIGRNVVEKQVTRTPLEATKRKLLRAIIPHPRRFGTLLGMGRSVRGILPKGLREVIPVRVETGHWPPAEQHRRQMLVLSGCVQSSIAPNINAAAARVLSRLGIGLIAVDDACCGAVSYHLNAQQEALGFMRRNIDAWWPYIEQGAEAVVMTASGCGVMVKEYAHLLRHDPDYAEKAARVSDLTLDISEVLQAEDLSKLRIKPESTVKQRVAFHAPCTLQHGQQLSGKVESILEGMGFTLVPVVDTHLCCGSAGTYSLLNAEIASQLRLNKQQALVAGDPEVIATANIGCLSHLQVGSSVPVMHWIDLIASG